MIDGADADRFPAAASASAWMACVLDDDRDGAGAADRWLTLLYDDPYEAGAEVLVVDGVASDAAISGRVAGLISYALVRGWSDGEGEATPIRPGRYLLPPAIANLLAGIDPAVPRSTGQRLSRGARVRLVMCETLGAWATGALIATEAAPGMGQAERLRLARARTLIEMRYSEKLTIDRIACACGMGCARLIRGFRTLYGRTVADMLAECRLARAATALRATDDPVSQIAHASGYRSNAAFTRAFARHYGASPSLFRTTA